MTTLVSCAVLVPRTWQATAVQVGQVSGVDYDEGGTLSLLGLAPVAGTDQTEEVTVDGVLFIERRFTLVGGNQFEQENATDEAKVGAVSNLFTTVFERKCKTAARVIASQIIAPGLPVPGAVLNLISSMGFIPPPPPVTRWIDESGSGNDVTQTVGGRKLDYVNGIVVGPTAAGTAEDRDAGDPSVVAAGNWTIFAMIDRNPDVSVQALYYALGFANAATGLYVQGTAQANWGITDGVTPLASGEALPPGRHLLTVTKTNLTYALRRDGVAKTSAVRLAAELTGVTVNRRGDLPPALAGGHGYPQIVVYPSALSAADIALVEQSMIDVWGVAP